MAEKKSTKQEAPESVDAYTEDLQQREQATGEQLVATAAETQAVYEDEAADKATKDAPAEFARFTDEAQAVAVAAWQAAKDRGASDQDAITDGVIAAKNWATVTSKPYKK